MSDLIAPRDEHNLDLLARVHPAGWQNPTPAKRYNLVVLGGGPAGLVSAFGAAGLGARVALVERGLLGGDCLNVGCVPSKALLRSARALHDAAAVGAFGARLEGRIEPDFTAAMARLRRLRAGLSPVDSAERLRAAGVDVFFGQGRFVAPDAVEVAGARLHFARAAITTGARSAIPPIPGLAAINPLTNESVFNLTELPARLLVLGAGPIGCEIGQAFRRFGTRVTLLTRGERILPRDDPEAAAVIARAFAREGIEVVTGADLTAAERRGSERVVRYVLGGRSVEASADQVLVALGRSANVESLDLERAGIAFGKEGVQVDDRLRTSNPRVYAAGDVCSPFKFTHAADAMARILIANALFHGRGKASRLVIPWCTYTDPEVAHVGLTPDEAKRQGIDIDTLTFPFREVDRAVLEDDTDGFARVHLARGSDRIVGATAVLRHAGEILAEPVLAMTRGIGLTALSSVVHAYPTESSVWQRLSDARRREKLTPGVKRWFELWMRWTR